MKANRNDAQQSVWIHSGEIHIFQLYSLKTYFWLEYDLQT